MKLVAKFSLLFINGLQNNIIMIVDKSFGNMAELNYLGTIITDRNYMYEEIKSRLILRSAYSYSVQNLLL
jgi:hypothetical protein